MQKYPRGSRGSPAKGVVSETVARVRISSSAPRKGTFHGAFSHTFIRFSFLRLSLCGRRELFCPLCVEECFVARVERGDHALAELFFDVFPRGARDLPAALCDLSILFESLGLFML